MESLVLIGVMGKEFVSLPRAGLRRQSRLIGLAMLALLLSGIPFVLPASASTPTTVSLTASPSPSKYGAAVTLTATVSPNSATGKVTFYDGSAVLGTHALSAGVAMLPVSLSTGTRTLFARYLGESSNAPSTSPVIQEVVKSVPGFGFSTTSQALGTDFAIAAVADFNGDGKADIVAVGSAEYSGNNLSVILGNGDGTFGAPIASLIESGAQLTTVAVADFNGDGKLDIAVAMQAGGIAVLLGQGDGTFAPPTDYPTAYGRIVIADFNNDGNADIAVTHAASSSIGILLGNGDGTFGPPQEYPGTDTPPYWGAPFLVAGDFNGDGNVDLVTATNGELDSSLNLLLGNGDGTFVSPAALPADPTGSNMYGGLAAGDLNGDGILDLVVSSDTMGVYLGHGDGTFAAPVSYPDGEPVVAVADVNGDGNADVITGGTIEVFPGNGDGTLQLAAIYSTGFGASSLAVGDFNGDGRIDLALRTPAPWLTRTRTMMLR